MALERPPTGAPGGPHLTQNSGGLSSPWGAPVNPPQGALGGGPEGLSEGAQQPEEEVLRILVVGDAATGKTALLQLLQQHAAELPGVCAAQVEENAGFEATEGTQSVNPKA